MYSVEKEKVDFPSVLNPVNKQVEDWMKEVETKMKQSVRVCLELSIKTYPPI